MGGGGTARFWALVRPEARDGTGVQGARSTGLRLWDLALGFGSFLSRPDSFGGEWSPPPSCWGLVGLLDLLRALRWRLRERRSAPSEALASLSLRSRRRRSRDFDSFRRLLFSFFPVTGDLSLVSVSSFSISVSFKSVSRNALSTQRPPRPSSQRQDCSHSPLRCPRREQIPPPAWADPGCC